VTSGAFRQRVGLGDLIGAGGRAVGRYTGTLLAVFVVQTLIAAVAMLAMAAVLALPFSHLPVWDDGVDGDLVALVACIRYAKTHVLACGGIAFAALLLWQLASWFLVGGLNGVLVLRPDGRGDTARVFGAAGAATYLKYARLALCSLPGWLLALIVFGKGMAMVGPRLEHALAVADLVAPLAMVLAPTLLVLHLVWTISDYARVELTLRHDSHDPGVVATYLRAAGFVLRRPITLVHGGLGWLVFLAITAGYAYLSYGHPMYGAEGAVTLFVIRQGVALARTATRFAVIAGEVELARTRVLPATRIDIKA
jgi:hypothetical protein